MLKLTIFRHGETDANKFGICKEQNLSLNKNGVAQAELLSKKLENVQFDIILSSPLNRAVETALIVANSTRAPVVIDENLVEVNTDVAKEMTYEEFYSKYITIFGECENVEDERFLDSKIPNGECRRDVIKRWLKVVKLIKNQYTDKKIGIASHYGFIKAVLFHHKHIDLDEIENCECFEIEI